MFLCEKLASDTVNTGRWLGGQTCPTRPGLVPKSHFVLRMRGAKSETVALLTAGSARITDNRHVQP